MADNHRIEEVARIIWRAEYGTSGEDKWLTDATAETEWYTFTLPLAEKIVEHLDAARVAS